jgi:microcystin-dependent protein
MAVVTPTAKAQFIDAAGIPLAGGLLYTYAAGTTTPQATYTDSTAATANSNPIVLDSRGEANIWLASATYKFKLCDSVNTELWTVDNIAAPTTALSPVLSGNVVIDTNSSGTALTINQSGTGALIKSVNPTTPSTVYFTVTNIGHIGVNTASPGSEIDVAGGSIQISSSGGTARTVMSADSTDSIFSANDSRNLTFKTNATTRLTINSTAATSTVPVVLPAVPTTDLQAATKSYVDGLTGAPSGVIMAFAGATAPTGFLACDGSAVSRTTYATLFAAISTTWGAGNGTTTFNVPDLRGTFLRGTGTNGTYGTAVGQAVGTYAADTYLNHSHTATSTDSGHTHSYNKPQASAGASGSAVSGNEAGNTTGTGYANITTTVATSTTGGTETKPKNYGVLYIIKT